MAKWAASGRLGAEPNHRPVVTIDPRPPQEVIDAFNNTTLEEIRKGQKPVPVWPERLPLKTKMSAAEWVDLRDNFVASLAELRDRYRDQVLDRMHLCACGVDPALHEPSPALAKIISGRRGHWSEFLTKENSDDHQFVHLLYVNSGLDKTKLLKRNKASELNFIIVEQEGGGLLFPASSADVVGRKTTTLRKVLFGDEDRWIKSIVTKTEGPFPTCLLAFCATLLRLRRDVEQFLPFINDLVDAARPGLSSRSRDYTDFVVEWLILASIKEVQDKSKQPSRCVWGEDFVKKWFTEGGSYFRDRDVSARGALQTSKATMANLKNRHMLFLDPWCAFLDELYRAMLAEADCFESADAKRTNDGPFAPSERHPLWALQSFLLLSILGCRMAELWKFSEFLPVEDDQYITFTEIGRQKHVLQHRAAKKGADPRRDPDEQSDYQDSIYVGKPVALPTASSTGVLRIYRHLIYGTENHFKHRAKIAPDASMLLKGDRPKSDYLSWTSHRAQILAEEDNQPIAMPPAKKMKVSTLPWMKSLVNAGNKKNIERPSQVMPNQQVSAALKGGGFKNTFEDLTRLYQERAKSEFRISHPHLLRAIYANVAWELYGNQSLVARPVFFSRVLGHTLEYENKEEGLGNLKTQMFYDKVKVMSKAVPSLHEPDLLKIVQAIVQQGEKLASDYARVLGDLKYVIPPRLTQLPRETRAERLRRQAVEFFAANLQHHAQELRRPGFWRGTVDSIFSVKASYRFASHAATALDTADPTPAAQITRFTQLC